MMEKENLKQKTISGIFWSFSDNILNYFTQFVIGIFLARLLSPTEFGLIGMITIFLSVSQSLIDSGFGQALIRKKDAGDRDFSTIFYFNILISLTIFGILFLSSGGIAKFYDQPALVSITKVMSFTLVISSAGLIQRTILTKAVNFKLQTKISFVSSVLSGIIAIILAYRGYGVWSLVWRSLMNNSLQVALLWIFNRWRPVAVFSLESFRDLFSFGSKLLASGLLDTLYKNIYLLVIGKYFSPQELGYYTRADNFSKLPSQVITETVQRVTYPALSTVSDDIEKLKAGYKKTICSTIFITFFCMICLAAIAKSLVLVLVGEKWLPSVIYLQLLCISGSLYPLHALNLNILKVTGRSDLFFNIEIIKKVLIIPVIILGIFTNIRIMIIGMIIHSVVGYFLNSFYSGNLINYPVGEQINDIKEIFFTALLTGAVVFSISLIANWPPFIILIVQMIAGVIITLTLAELLNLKGYNEIRSILKERVSSLMKK